MIQPTISLEMPVPSQVHYGQHFLHFSWLPYLYTFSLYDNAPPIIVSAQTEYI
jgi:hypothetical protein